MGKTLDRFYKNQPLIYKYILYALCIGSIVFFFPKGSEFNYEFETGKPWQYEDLRAPFDFSVLKTTNQLTVERTLINSNKDDYYKYDSAIVKEVYERYNVAFIDVFSADDYNANQLRTLSSTGTKILNQLYAVGIINNPGNEPQGLIYLAKNDVQQAIEFRDLVALNEVESLIEDFLNKNQLSMFNAAYQELFFDLIKPNVFYDKERSEKVIADQIAKVSEFGSTVQKDKLLITKDEVVKEEQFELLSSLRNQYQSELWAGNNYYYILIGYTVLVALVLLMLFLFLKKYRPKIYENNTKVTFVFFNILLMVFITTMMVKYNEAYVYVVPLCILPLLLKTFFDARLALFVHVLTILILGFVVPNSFEYIFLQIIAGIVTILTVSQLYKRANLFITVAQITFIYLVGYLAFHTIQEGNLSTILWYTLGLFLLNGMLTIFVQPLIYIYEKIFGLVSDVSLLELSDTNSKLLKELANKAPGTFHHSLQVSNLAEAAANEIGANAMLVRVGALYHDIGKMDNPTYFTENQITNMNPHDDLEPNESARIIIDHIIKGIEIARKNNIPDRVIDFIRAHHGTTLVYYFYKKQKDIEEHVNEEDFRYPGPLPFSKETAILMMADSVEAASKSLKNPTFMMIDEFVDKIVAGQMAANQFVNANITFKEIEAIKKIFKQKLTNIYHLRVEYPE